MIYIYKESGYYLIFGPGLIFRGGAYIQRAYIRGAYSRREFCVSVRVSRPQNSLLYIAIIGKKGVSLGQNHFFLL